MITGKGSAISVALAACLIHTTWGQDSHWSGLNNDGLWASPNNWNPVRVPSSSVDANVWLDSANGWSVITITDGELENPGSGSSDMIYGPEFGAGLNIYGTLNWRNYLVPVQNDPTHPSIVNLFNGSSVSGVGICLGDSWWYSGGPHLTLNLYGNAFPALTTCIGAVMCRQPPGHRFNPMPFRKRSQCGATAACMCTIRRQLLSARTSTGFFTPVRNSVVLFNEPDPMGARPGGFLKRTALGSQGGAAESLVQLLGPGQHSSG